jgi:hypothetical protein
VAQTGALVRALQEALKESNANLRQDMSEIKTHTRADYHRTIYMFGAGFVLICCLFGWGYTRVDDHLSAAASRLDDKIATLSTTATRIDTKMEDLLARMPPVQTPIPHK